MERRSRIPINSKVRRVLFGRPSKDDPLAENRENLCQEEENQSERETAKQRWNFDFLNETPLDGIYQWERCEMGQYDYIGAKRRNETGRLGTADNSEPTRAVARDKSESFDESVIDFRRLSETTPDKQKCPSDSDCEPIVKVRRMNESVSETIVRRSISF